MTYQPKIIGKTAVDFLNFDPLYLSKVKSNVYFDLQELCYGVLSVPGKKFFSQQSSVFKLTLSPTPCCYELDVM